MLPSQLDVLVYPLLSIRVRTSRKSFNHSRLSKVSDGTEAIRRGEYGAGCKIRQPKWRQLLPHVLTINGKLDG